MSSYTFLPSISSTNQTTTTAPGGPQAGALNTIYGGLADAYAKSNAMGPYSGDFYSGINPYLQGAYDQAGNFGAANGGVGQTQINTGQGLLGNYGAASNAAGALYNYGTQNQTQNNIATANAYANNPYINALVDSAMDDGQRVAAEQTLPSLYRGAAGTGNINSDRVALSEGVVKRGLGEMAAGMSAKVRGDMWNQGLSTALTQSQQGLGALSNAGTLSSNLGNAGSGLMSQGINDQANLSKLYESAGLGVQGQADRGLANDQAKYNSNYQFPWQNLQNYYNIAGNNNWWGTQNQSGTSVGFSPVQNQRTAPGALGILGAGLGLAGSVAGLGMGGGASLGGMAAGALFPSIGGALSPRAFGSYGPQPAY